MYLTNFMPMKRLLNFGLMMILVFGISTLSFGQCQNWNDSPRKDDGEAAHSIYRQAIKTKDMDLAFEQWKIAFEIAPAADGKRDFHFTDGAKLYLEKFKKETDKAKKEEYKNKAIELINQAIDCYENGAIKLTKCGDNKECIDKRIGYLAGRLAYDMFYTYNTPYSQTLDALEKSIAKSGNDVEYIVFDPYASIAVYQFKNGKMSKEEVLALYAKLNKLADYNIENNTKFKSYFEQAKKAMNAKFDEISDQIFDCDYFVEKLKPDYEAGKDDPQVWKIIIAKLKKHGCDGTNPFLAEVEGRYKKWANETNAAKQAEFEANNPALLAKKAYDAGDYQTAIAKYQEAINKETDPEAQAKHYFKIASIQFRKLKKYGEARATARKAAKLKSGWGRPYMLIGDMYGSSARGCGDSWNQRLAILAAVDKYSYAKSIDPSVTEEANKRISKYRKSFPSKEDGFQRGIKAGQSVKVGCWIGETVKVRYK